MAQPFDRNKGGIALDFKGMNTILPPDRLQPGKYPYAQNVRRYKQQATVGRDLQSAALFAAAAKAVAGIRRLNDSTPNGPAAGFVLVVVLADGTVNINGTLAGGLGGTVPPSLIPFRPNQSVQPWMYMAGGGPLFKVRSDGTFYAVGAPEPLSAPLASFAGGGTVPTQYRYVFRSTTTGKQSNPSPPSISGLRTDGTTTNLTALSSSGDPELDVFDFYRFGGALLNYTYVGTTPRVLGTFADTITDLAAAANPVLAFDNFQPFPSIDLPRQGTCNVTAGSGSQTIVNWVSGDLFNLRWLPGTIIVINQIAYTLYSRPLTSTTLLAVDATGVFVPIQGTTSFQISQPNLAAQPMTALWGPTDNVAFMFGCGDPLRPGTLYFTKGNNPDSASYTNQIDVTSPSEPLIGGCIVNGLSLIGSTERFWLAFPNFFNALATVTGTQGSPFTLVLSISNRGLWCPTGICTDGGGVAFFISKDGIYISIGGQGSQSITDEDLYNLFPHEGSTPANVVIAGNTVFVPDWSKSGPAAKMTLSFSLGYLYWDYQDLTATQRTLVYDVAAKGWVVDAYQTPVRCHANAEGQADGVYVGCTDGTVRQLLSAGAAEAANAILALPAFNDGDNRAQKQFGDIFVEAQVAVAKPVAIAIYSSLFNTAILGFSPATLVPAAVRSPYIIDFQNDTGVLAVDLEAVFTWAIDPGTVLYTWQPTYVLQPESTLGRPTDWDDAGTPGTKFVQGLIIEADSFNVAKTFQAQVSDDLSLHPPNEVPATWNGQSTKSFSFTPPFVAHSMRIISTDGVLWRRWGVKWVFEPYPESVFDYETEGTSHGLVGFQHIRELNIAHISTADLSLVLTFDTWPTITLIVPNSAGKFIKTKVTVNPNKFKVVSYKLVSTAGFRFFKRDLEVKVKQWGSGGAYQIIRPFGGSSALGAVV